MPQPSGWIVGAAALVAGGLAWNTGFPRVAAAATTFSYAGTTQIYVVPAGVTLLAVDAYGGQGGVSDESACQSGGFGGRTRATLSVTPGEVLHVEVAGAGSRYGGADPASWYRGGYNGGGDGHLDTVGGSRGGGGASDVRQAPYGLGDRLVVAGGGGGAGNLAAVSSGGAGGGTAGGMGAPAPNGGGGGTQNVGGAAGPTDTPVSAAATAGSAGQGGIGGYSGGVGAFTGGGGGGGWFGGGGAGGRASTPGAGGGGGSSFGPAGSAFDSGVWGNTGDCSAPDQGPRAGSVAIGPTPSAGTFHSLPPVRLLDTRTGVGAPAGLVSGDAVVELDVLDQGGVPVANVDAVVLNVTVTEPLGSGFVTAYPCGGTRPVVSNLNYVAGQTVPNLVTVKLGAGGKVCLYTLAPTHLLADVSGWYSGAGAQVGAHYQPLTPGRVLDTRNGSKLAQGDVLRLTVLGQKGVPGSGVSAVTMNVTVTEPDVDGFLTVYPCGQTRPIVSNLNYVAAQTVPNLVTVKLGDAGQVCVYAQRSTHVVADVTGWYGPDGDSAGSAFTALAPDRQLDTRNGTGAAKQHLTGGSTLQLSVLGRSGVPPIGVEAVVLNVTVTDPVANGFVTVYPCGEQQPVASSLNFVAAQTVPNLVIAKVGVGGQVCLFTTSTADLLADVSGWFGPEPG